MYRNVRGREESNPTTPRTHAPRCYYIPTVKNVAVANGIDRQITATGTCPVCGLEKYSVMDGGPDEPCYACIRQNARGAETGYRSI